MVDPHGGGPGRRMAPAAASPGDAAVPSRPPPGMERVSLVDGHRYDGLIESEDDAWVYFIQIQRPPGRPMHLVIRTLDRRSVASVVAAGRGRTGGAAPADRAVRQPGRHRSRPHGRRLAHAAGEGRQPLPALRGQVVQPRQHGRRADDAADHRARGADFRRLSADAAARGPRRRGRRGWSSSARWTQYRAFLARGAWRFRTAPASWKRRTSWPSAATWPAWPPHGQGQRPERRDPPRTEATGEAAADAAGRDWPSDMRQKGTRRPRSPAAATINAAVRRPTSRRRRRNWPVATARPPRSFSDSTRQTVRAALPRDRSTPTWRTTSIRTAVRRAPLAQRGAGRDVRGRHLGRRTRCGWTPPTPRP